jgi:hypothetical protein
MSATLEEQTINKLYDKINTTKKTDKKNVTEKQFCRAAVKYTVKKDAYDDITKKNIKVYLVKDDKTSKTSSYSQCGNNLMNNSNNECLCNRHNKMFIEKNPNLKFFETDILPQNESDKKRWLATKTDDFFTNMGTKGKKKDTNPSSFDFDDINDPILMILNNKNRKLRSALSQYAMSLTFKKEEEENDLRKNNVLLDDLEQKKTSVEEAVKMKQDNSPIQNKNTYHSEKEEEEDNASSHSEKEEEEDIDNASSHSEKEEEEDVDNASSHSEEEEEEDSEGIVCIVISTKERVKLYYYEEEKIVYDLDREEIGQLIEVQEKYHSIFYKNKYYTVCTVDSISSKGNVYNCIYYGNSFNKDFVKIEK